MDKFIVHQGIAAPILHINIDTDTIIPSSEMKRVSKRGLGAGLFAAWRYTRPGSRDPNPEFILNQAQFADTSIILARHNFGCGSSREHAVWALKEYGIRAIIAPSFSGIFFNNCIRNGILPVILPDDIINSLVGSVVGDPQQNQLRIDLPAQSISTADAQQFHFVLHEAHKMMLLNGLDTIALTETLTGEITRFERQDRRRRPWIYL